MFPLNDDDLQTLTEMVERRIEVQPDLLGELSAFEKEFVTPMAATMPGMHVLLKAGLDKKREQVHGEFERIKSMLPKLNMARDFLRTRTIIEIDPAIQIVP